jgi:hypothetical protein
VLHFACNGRRTGFRDCKPIQHRVNKAVRKITMLATDQKAIKRKLPSPLSCKLNLGGIQT